MQSLDSRQAKHPDKEWLDNVIHSFEMFLQTENEYAKGNTSQILGEGAIKEAEALMCRLYGCLFARLVPSATYGLRVCMQVSDVKIGDEVIVPEVDWLASKAAIVSLNANPVCAAVNSRNVMDVKRIEGLITGKTKAIVATHFNGVPVDISKIRHVLAALRRPDIKIIEDCAQGFMIKYRNKLCGTSGDFSVFSFGPNKQVDVGECGMILCREREAYEQAVRYTGHPVNLLLNGVGDKPPPDALSIRPNPLSAVLLVTELRKIVEDRAASAHANGTEENN